MKILGIDTSSPTTCAAVMEDDRILGEIALTGRVSHSEQLVEMCENMLKGLAIPLKEMDLIAVGIGPGSFTGLRIGITVAKILSQALDIPLVGVSSLGAYAMNERGLVAAITDARRGSIYCTLIRHEQEYEVYMEDCVMSRQEFVAKMEGLDRLVLTGPDAEKFISEFPENTVLARNSQMRGSHICKLGKWKYETEGADNTFALVPNYLKVSQAQRQYDEQHSTGN